MLLAEELSPEQQAFMSEYYEKLFEKLYKTAAVLLKNSYLAEDAVQDTFCKATKKIIDFMDSPCPEGWLYNALYNEIKHVFRTRDLLLKRRLPLEEAYRLPPAEMPEINELDVAHNSDLQLMVRCYLYGYTIQDIADEWGLTPGAVKMRIKRAKDRLRQDPDINSLKEVYF